MDTRTRSAAVGGALLILLGALLLLAQINPDWRGWLGLQWSWPLIVVAVGAGLFLMGLLTGTPSMAIPACVVAGIGGILYWQNLTGNWLSWTYAWALIPGFVGVGMILQALLGEGGWSQAGKGFESILVSLVLFAIFGSIFGGLPNLGPFWPALLILVGVVQLVRRVLRPFPPSAPAVLPPESGQPGG
ncbi:MAG TPA: hypothetical protein VK449_06750 [Anaerolineales bacterium]|nr:hypothetical protein [Anaerolineales bacterium]